MKKLHENVTTNNHGQIKIKKGEGSPTRDKKRKLQQITKLTSK